MSLPIFVLGTKKCCACAAVAVELFMYLSYVALWRLFTVHTLHRWPMLQQGPGSNIRLLQVASPAAAYLAPVSEIGRLLQLAYPLVQAPLVATNPHLRAIECGPCRIRYQVNEDRNGCLAQQQMF